MSLILEQVETLYESAFCNIHGLSAARNGTLLNWAGFRRRGTLDQCASTSGKMKMRTTLPIRIKKLIGTFLIVALVIVYSLVAVAVATATLAEAPWYAHLAYFGFTGILWVLPAMAIIKWMSTESAS